MNTQHYLTLRAFPRKQEFGGGFGARVHIVPAKQSIIAEQVFESYEAARNWAKLEAHRVMGDQPYRLCSLKQSKANQNRFYNANVWVAA